MRAIKPIFLLAIFSISLMSFTPVKTKWDFLGKRTVNFALDRDEIKVTLKEGTFKKVKFQVKKAPVNFNKVIVHYRNGSTETLKLRSKIPAGGQTRAIDLNGQNRIISKVVFYYNSNLKSKNKAIVQLYGMH